VAPRALDRQLALIGRGDGLTPFEDDVLCGMLVTLSASGHRAVGPARAALQAADLESRTAATSAALLRLAADGYCIDVLSDHLTALVSGSERALLSTRSAVATIGHSSGRGLLAGVDAVIGTPTEAAA